MRYSLLVIVVLLLFSCAGDQKGMPEISAADLQEKLLQANINAASIESKQIKAYVKKELPNAIQTKTGLSYSIIKDQVGEVAQTGDLVALTYSVKLLDGTLCYSTSNGPEEFVVGKDNVESGLHEGITYLSKGDKAIFVIPSHLAHGLTGDFKKIPIRSTIVYDLEVVDIVKVK